MATIPRPVSASVARPSLISLPPPTSNRAQLITLISILAGVGATYAVNPDSVISRVLTQTAHLYRLLYSPSSPSSSSSSSFAPAAYVESVLNSAASYVDEQGLKLQLRARLVQFDEQSPVDHRTLVKLAIGLLAFAGTRGLCRAALK